MQAGECVIMGNHELAPVQRQQANSKHLACTPTGEQDRSAMHNKHWSVCTSAPPMWRAWSVMVCGIAV